MAILLRPVPTVNKCKRRIWNILLEDTEQLRLLPSVYKQDLCRLENGNLRDRLDVCLAITDLTQHRLCCGQIHKRQPYCRRNSSRLAYRTDYILGRHTCCRGRSSCPVCSHRLGSRLGSKRHTQTPCTRHDDTIQTRKTTTEGQD